MFLRIRYIRADVGFRVRYYVSNVGLTKNIQTIADRLGRASSLGESVVIDSIVHSHCNLIKHNWLKKGI